MGIPLASAEFLIEAARAGVSFRDTATVGRQHLMVGPWRLSRMLRRAGFDGELRWAPGESPWFADPLFKALGAQSLSALDASDYEGASVVADLNEPVPAELHQRFSVVFDGGSLEHIFHATTALRSYMEMVRVGGHLLLTLPANNTFGHGLYQFGPDFFFRALSQENGFSIERALAMEHDVDAPASFLGTSINVEKRGSRYEVVDPAEARLRVQLVNSKPVLMLIQARRISVTPIFSESPQQSDYSARWSQHRLTASPGSEGGGVGPRIRRLLGTRAQQRLLLEVLPTLAPLLDPLRSRRHRRRRSFRNRRSFIPAKRN